MIAWQAAKKLSCMLPDEYRCIKTVLFSNISPIDQRYANLSHALHKKASVDLNVATVAFVAFFVSCILSESIKYCSSSITIYCQINLETHAFSFLQIFNQLVKMLHRGVVVRYFLAVQSGGFFSDSVSALLRFIFDVSLRRVFAKILFPSDIMWSIKSLIQLE